MKYELRANTDKHESWNQSNHLCTALLLFRRISNRLHNQNQYSNHQKPFL